MLLEKLYLDAKSPCVTFLVRIRTYGHNFPLVQFFITQGFQWGGGGGGGASLLENWILQGDEEGNFPVNAFVFLSIAFGLIFGAKL